MDLRNIYKIKNIELDYKFYSLEIPFFKNIFKYGENHSIYYEKLSDHCKDFFRKVFYLCYHEIKVEKHIFIEFVEFLDYIQYEISNKKWFPYFTRYLYNFKDNIDFMIKTIRFHKNKYFVFEKDFADRDISFLCLLSNIDFNDNIYENVKDRKDENSLIIHGLCLLKGLGVSKNIEKANQLFYNNWTEYKNKDSLFYFALNSSDKKLILQNAFKNKHLDSLIYCVETEKNNTKLLEKACFLLWKNFRYDNILDTYINICVNNINSDKCLLRELLYNNWLKNKNTNDLYFYTTLEKDLNKRRDMYLSNWNQYKNKQSLISYIHMAKLGIGGDRDINKISELEKFL